MQPDIPHVEGILSATEVEQTAASIAAMQEADGAIPWTPGEHTDVWNHVESAMALLVGGQLDGRGRGPSPWCLDTQREDGSWPMKIVAGEVEDASGETNMSAYLAVGVWHHWLVRRDFGVRRTALARGAPRAGLGRRRCSCPSAASPGRRSGHDGRPAKVNDEALLAGSSSIYHVAARRGRARRAGRGAAARVGARGRPPRPRAARAPRPVPGQVDLLDGLVLPGPRRRGPRRGRRTRCSPTRWDDFVEPGLGIRCVDHQPVGDRRGDLRAGAGPRRARRPRAGAAAVRRHAAPARHDEGRYWTGYVFPDEVNWPVEHTTYTAAAVILAADALAHATPGVGHHARHDAARRLRRDRPGVRLPRSADRVPGVAAPYGVAPASSPAPRPR